MDRTDKIMRIYARLNSLKDNLPKNSISEKYVQEYNSLGFDLEKIAEIDLPEFKIPDDMLKKSLMSMNMRTGEKNYSSHRYCERNFALVKIDAVLSYFNLKFLSKEKEQMGFALPHS